MDWRESTIFWSEGGPETASAFLAADLIDRCSSTGADPDRRGKAALAGIGLDSLDGAHIRRCGSSTRASLAAIRCKSTSGCADVTGIVTDIGRIEAVEPRGDLRVRIACGYDMATVDLGASIACSGVCLTVVDKGEGWFAVDVSAETQRRTAPGMWAEGNRLNLERALKVGDELGGHIVTGHVDGLGEVIEAGPENESVRLVIQAPPALAGYLSEKGSIAVNGISLTVNGVEDGQEGPRFGVNIIPHTAKHTAMFETGDKVNLEVDILARYLGRMLEVRNLAV